MTLATGRARRAGIWVALGTDTLCILTFCVLGRLSHEKGVTVAGIAETARPFLLGAGAGWLVSLGWRRPLAVVPTGIAVWLGTIVLGMVMRQASSQGVALSFVLVASAVTATLLLGWRILATRLMGPRGRLCAAPTN